MKTTRAATTRRLTDTPPYLVTVWGPDGRMVKSVVCRFRSDAMEVIETEALDAPVWTMLFLSRRRGRGYEVVARWAVGPKGLARAPRRRQR